MNEQSPIVQGGYLTIDPGGTNPKILAKGAKKGNTGYFYYVNPQSYEIGTIDGENSVAHGEKLNMLIKKLKPLYVAWETSQNISVRFMNEQYKELLYLNGIIPYILKINGIKNIQKIINLEVDRALNSGNIERLELMKVQGDKGRPKNTFFFNGKSITEHETDAIAVFYVYWVKFLKRP